MPLTIQPKISRHRTLSPPMAMRARCRDSIVSKVGVSSTRTFFSPFGPSSGFFFLGLAGLLAEDLDLAGTWVRRRRPPRPWRPSSSWAARSSRRRPRPTRARPSRAAAGADPGHTGSAPRGSAPRGPLPRRPFPRGCSPRGSRPRSAAGNTRSRTCDRTPGSGTERAGAAIPGGVAVPGGHAMSSPSPDRLPDPFRVTRCADDRQVEPVTRYRLSSIARRLARAFRAGVAHNMPGRIFEDTFPRGGDERKRA